MIRHLLVTATLAAGTVAALAADVPAAFDPALAARTGADEHGMRHYVLVVLKAGPNHMAKGPERDAMFRGHFANIRKLAEDGKLAVAGPFEGGADGWEGLFVLAVTDLDEARRLIGADPVVVNGEMTPEFHPWYASAALMLVPGDHAKVARAPF